MFGNRKSEQSGNPNVNDESNILEELGKEGQVDDEWLVVKPSSDGTRIDPSTKAGKDFLKSNDCNTGARVESVGVLVGPSLPKAEVDENDANILSLKDLRDLEHILGPINWNQLAASAANTYYLLKRNLKAVVLLFLLGILVQEMSRSSTKMTTPVISEGIQDAMPPRYNQLLQKLRAQVKDLELSNHKLVQELHMMLMERNGWRSLAMGCEGDLLAMTTSHAELEEAVKQTKLLAPVPFASPIESIPRKQLNTTAIPIPFPSPVIELQPKAAPATDSWKRSYSALVVSPSRAVTAV